MEKKYNLITIRDANLLYLIPMVLFFIIDELSFKIKMVEVSYYNKMLLISLIEIVFLLAPIALFVYFKKWEVGHLFRLNKIRLDNLVLSSVIMLFAIPVTALINAIVIFILYLLGKAHAQPSFPAENIPQLIITLLAVAITPAVVEELMCRGAILRGYEKWGIRGSLLMSSFLFALLHRDIQSLVGTFLLGLLIAYIVYRTNSIFAGMIAHFTNNSFIVVTTFLSTRFSEKSVKAQDFSNLAAIPTEQLIVGIIFLIMIALSFGAALIGWLWLLKYNTKDIDRENVTEVSKEKMGKAAVILLYTSFALVLFRYFEQLGIINMLGEII